MEIILGAMSTPISEQLTNQGIKFDDKSIEHLQKDADAITRLYMRDLIGQTTANTLREKLYQKIYDEVNKPKVELKPVEKPYTSGHNFSTCEHCGAKQRSEQPEPSFHLYDIEYECDQTVTFVVGDRSYYIDSQKCSKLK